MRLVIFISKLRRIFKFKQYVVSGATYRRFLNKYKFMSRIRFRYYSLKNILNVFMKFILQRFLLPPLINETRKVLFSCHEVPCSPDFSPVKAQRNVFFNYAEILTVCMNERKGFEHRQCSLLKFFLPMKFVCVSLFTKP